MNAKYSKLVLQYLPNGAWFQTHVYASDISGQGHLLHWNKSVLHRNPPHLGTHHFADGPNRLFGDGCG